MKQLTTKPVVGVGRFTSPDEMVRQVQSGVLDFIGAARTLDRRPIPPEQDRSRAPEDIRECIGFNICVTGDNLVAPIRCTQYPSMGEEWRCGWHPERIPTTTSRSTVMVIGAGPSGLEAAQALGKRGFEVAVMEATREIGGRALREAAMPGLASWRRVVDYRVAQIDQLPNVEIHRESPTTIVEALSYGFTHVAIATGATWRADGAGRTHLRPIPISVGAHILTPDDLLAGGRPSGDKVVIFDDDHYYLGSVLAELLVSEGHTVEL